MDARTLAMFVVSLLAVAACDRAEKSKPASAPAADSAPAARQVPAKAAPSFVNRVWKVAESEQVAAGSLRVFLSDGTLVMASPHATPALGAWRYDDGRLTITEEGQEYPADILALSESAFRIRMHSAGEPVEIRFAPAEQPSMGLTPGEERADVAKRAKIEQATADLWGTAWQLENLAGADVPDGAQATLEFPSEGRASGNGSCNRFNGVVTVEGSTIQFGGIAATRKACADAVMRQEDAYFAALREAERFEIEGEALRIYAADRAEPLHFAAAQATAELPGNSIQRAPAASALPTPAGIWTVVGHHLPGTSALSDDEARARYGETVRLTARSAIAPGAQCREPRYAARRAPANQYLADEFKLPADSLKPLAGRSQIQVMEVSCAGAPWRALGARLIEVDRDRALAPWNGVFFELARDRDFRALGQEPGWQLEIRKGAEMRFIYDYGRGMAVTPASRTQVDSNTGTRNYHAVTEANDLRVVIVPVACTDTMSGRPFPATVSVTLNGRSFRGCGEDLATPYQG
jgi:heat shock protein HslJ/uncharacterized membrane protein